MAERLRALALAQQETIRAEAKADRGGGGRGSLSAGPSARKANLCAGKASIGAGVSCMGADGGACGSVGHARLTGRR